MGIHGTLWNSMRIHEIQWKSMKSNGNLWNSMRSGEKSLEIVSLDSGDQRENNEILYENRRHLLQNSMKPMGINEKSTEINGHPWKSNVSQWNSLEINGNLRNSAKIYWKSMEFGQGQYEKPTEINDLRNSCKQQSNSAKQCPNSAQTVTNSAADA